MNPSWKRASRAVALILTLALVQVYVVAAPWSAPISGRLSAAGLGKVVLNGNEVTSGATLFSGAQVRTPDATGATLTLAGVGTIDVAPRSSLTVTFDRASVSVLLAEGDARVTAGEGVKGSLTTPDGKTLVTGGESGSSVGTPLYSQTQIPNNTNHPCTILEIPCALFWVLVGGGTAVSIYFAKRGSNPSPANP